MTRAEAEKICTILNEVLPDRYWHLDLRDELKKGFPEHPWACVIRDSSPSGEDYTLILRGPDNDHEKECK